MPPWKRAGGCAIVIVMAKTDDTIYTLLVRAYAIAQKIANDMMIESGVSPLEAWVLEAIPEDGRACASEVAAELEVPTSTVTRALRRLEECGYVKLTKGIFLDARVLRPELTPLGTGVRDGALGFERDIDARLLAGIQPRALGGLMAGLIHLERVGQRWKARGDAEPSQELGTQSGQDAGAQAWTGGAVVP